jgi:hypothetical protein
MVCCWRSVGCCGRVPFASGATTSLKDSFFYFRDAAAKGLRIKRFNVFILLMEENTRNKYREKQVYVAISSPECRSKSGYKYSKQIV